MLFTPSAGSLSSLILVPMGKDDLGTSQVRRTGRNMGSLQLAADNYGHKSSDQLVKENMALVGRIARRYARTRPDLLEDLEQVGAIGLLKAIRYYDPDRSKASFKTVATCYIKGEILHYLRDNACLVQVPRKFNEINSAIGQLEEALSRQLGRAPTLTELSESSGIAQNEILAAQQSWDACTHYESLEATGDSNEDDDNRSLNEMVPDKKYQDFQLASEDRELISNAIQKLSDKTSKIVQFVFFYDLTQKETARILGLSEMVVSRAVNSGLKSLKSILGTEII